MAIFDNCLDVYKICKQIDVKKVLILTNDSAILNPWYDSYIKFIEYGKKSGYYFVSNYSALENKTFCYTRKNFIKAEIEEFNGIFAFASFKNLENIYYSNNSYDINNFKWITNTDNKGTKWDVLVLDLDYLDENIDLNAILSQINYDKSVYLSKLEQERIAAEKAAAEKAASEKAIAEAARELAEQQSQAKKEAAERVAKEQASREQAIKEAQQRTAEAAARVEAERIAEENATHIEADNKIIAKTQQRKNNWIEIIKKIIKFLFTSISVIITFIIKIIKIIVAFIIKILYIAAIAALTFIMISIIFIMISIISCFL